MEKLKKELTLFDVYVISTGAMFSSGFFLLPGIAAAKTGPSVVLAYLASGALAVPAMFSLAELSMAMPRAGGTYYFLDRSLGPLAGTMAGFGTWLALVFKSAFALVGMGWRGSETGPSSWAGRTAFSPRWGWSSSFSRGS